MMTSSDGPDTAMVQEWRKKVQWSGTGRWINPGARNVSRQRATLGRMGTRLQTRNSAVSSIVSTCGCKFSWPGNQNSLIERTDLVCSGNLHSRSSDANNEQWLVHMRLAHPFCERATKLCHADTRGSMEH
jgi:hypothetical protein